MKYLDELNEPQRKAVEHIHGPVMVIAGAGSGKTRVLTYRIAHLINNGVDPFNILSLTFTNKAAGEMKERIGEIIGGSEARNIWMGTFHSVFAKILRFEAEKLNYPSNFTIYDSQDSKSLMNTIIKEHSLDDKIYKTNLVLSRVSAAKNNLITPQKYMQNSQIMAEDAASGRPKIGQLYLEYWNRCIKASAMDFDDLLFKTNILLRDYPEVLHKYQHRFKYILVDEYQDTNHAQYLIVKKLAAANQNLCVVGDDAQSIYAFRGANIENILNFKKDYPDNAIYKLEQNYRSSQNIVNAANCVISFNKGQIQKNVWTSNETGDKIKVHKSSSDNEEARFVSDQIFETHHQNTALYSDFAILYRTNAQSRSLEEALRKDNIPYKIFGGLSFYQRKEIKDLIAYYRLIANPNDEEALKRIINYPARGIGKTTVEKLMIAAGEHDKSIWDIVCAPKHYHVGLNAGALNKIDGFKTMIESFKIRLDKTDAAELAEEIAKSTGILRDLYADKTPEGVARYENIQELLNGIKEFTEDSKIAEPDALVTLSDFLLDVALLTDVEQKDEDPNRVSLMTIHSAKGLEFPYVNIVGLEENLFPSQMAISSRTELEEERRLFYVALTRAKKKCTLSYASTRFKWGTMNFCEPSRFLEEIDEQYLDKPSIGRTRGHSAPTSATSTNFKPAEQGFSFKKKVAPTPPPRTVPRNLKKVDTTNSAGIIASNLENLQAGQEVQHEKFGKGKVLEIEGTSPNTKAKVYFPNAGQKQLLLKYAKLTILS